MNSKVLLAALIGAVASFIAGFIVFGLLLGSYMAAGISPGLVKTAEEMSGAAYVHIFLASFASSLLIAYIFDSWANIRTLQGGLRAGALIGGLMALSVDLGLFATTHMFSGIGKVIVDVLASTLVTASGAAAIGWWLGRNPA
jgi:hypothetical protein